MQYQQILQRELESRCKRNPRYSLRAFAKDLKLDPARLSLVMRGKRGISRAIASQIATRLNLNPKESEIFCDLVESKHARNKVQRRLALLRVEQMAWGQSHVMQLDTFALVSDWYHFAILEMTELENFQSSETWIAQRLGISLQVTRAALERLFRMELLVKTPDGKWIAKDSLTITPDGTPSEAIRKFHTQILERATQALEVQTVEERHSSAVLFGIDPEQIPAAKERIRHFRRGFSKSIGEPKKKSDVYCLSVQFFRITTPQEMKK